LFVRFLFLACQGLKKPNNAWVCKRCLSEKKKPHKSAAELKKKCVKLAQETFCKICHKAEGSMIRHHGDWVHNACIAWLPGFTFGGEDNVMQPVCKNVRSVLFFSFFSIQSNA
jgi:hypothetical protein